MLLARDFYLKKLIGHKNNRLIKVLTGARRVGKSTLLFELFRDHLVSGGVNINQILMFRMDQQEDRRFLDPSLLLEHVKKERRQGFETYVFIDEVQNIPGFEKMLNSLNQGLGCNVYVTGSNSKMLSYEINTLLRGRVVEIRVFPLTFAEIYQGGEFDQEELFEHYLTFGGLPELLYYTDNQFKIEYLTTYLKDVVSKDIIERYQLRANNQFEQVLQVVMSLIGAPVSAKKIADTFKSAGFKSISVDTIQNYLRFLVEANLVNAANPYNIKGRRYVSFRNKYYAFDLGIRNAILNFRQLEPTHLLENLVFNELLRRYGRADIGINGDKEIDFIVNNVDRKYYLQVCLNITDPATIRRKRESFSGLDDGHKKIIITRTKSTFRTLEEGYILLDIFDFLTNEAALEEA